MLRQTQPHINPVCRQTRESDRSVHLSVKYAVSGRCGEYPGVITKPPAHLRPEETAERRSSSQTEHSGSHRRDSSSQDNYPSSQDSHPSSLDTSSRTITLHPWTLPLRTFLSGVAPPPRWTRHGGQIAPPVSPMTRSVRRNTTCPARRRGPLT